MKRTDLIRALEFAGCATLVLPALLLAADTWDVGLTEKGTVIEAASVPAGSRALPTVLLVGGLAGPDESVRIVRQELQTFEAINPDRRRFRLLAIPLANPDRASLAFPPVGIAYRDNPESHALWRWVAIQAPDLVLIVGNQDFGLAEALSQNAVAGGGRVPASR